MAKNEHEDLEESANITKEFFKFGRNENSTNLASRSPRLNRKNCFYIVSATLIEGNNVLLVSEAKLECRGKWYLPTGKVKKYENLIDAFRRELEEESFIKGDPDHLISMNSNIKMGRWLRFNFAGHRTGGRLKTLEDQDKDSLEAKWVPLSDVFDGKIELSHTDIIQIIRDAVEWFSIKSNGCTVHMSLPLSIQHEDYYVRLFIIKTDWKNRLQVILTKDGDSFPVMNVYGHLLVAMENYKVNKGMNFEFLGLLSIEHFIEKPCETDGVCLNGVSEYVDDDSFDVENSAYYFKDCDQKLLERLKAIHDSKTYIRYY